MNKYEIIRKIEDFASPELAESWDCSGWGVETDDSEIHKIMLCLTVTNDIVNQAKEENCDMIISHHPLFYVPFEWQYINIYSAHTNLDRTEGGTTDTLIKTLGFDIYETSDFVRYVQTDISIKDFAKKLAKISPNFRYVNNRNLTRLNKIGFCAGSGSDFIKEAYENGADAFITGDVKFHTALDSKIVVFDIGHFESEILVLDVFEKLINGIEVVRAKEKSPFLEINY